MALASCVVLGCAISSYVNRRRAHDRYQALFFLIAGGAVAGATVVAEASKQLVLLAYVPWAACLAMAVSLAAHALWRQLLRPGPNQAIQADGKYSAPRRLPYQHQRAWLADSRQRKGRSRNSHPVDSVSRRWGGKVDGDDLLVVWDKLRVVGPLLSLAVCCCCFESFLYDVRRTE